MAVEATPAAQTDLPDRFPEPEAADGSEQLFTAVLPTLCNMHDTFGVDCHESRTGFMVGARDWLSRGLADNPTGRLAGFVPSTRMHCWPNRRKPHEPSKGCIKWA